MIQITSRAESLLHQVIALLAVWRHHRAGWQAMVEMRMIGPFVLCCSIASKEMP